MVGARQTVSTWRAVNPGRRTRRPPRCRTWACPCVSSRRGPAPHFEVDDHQRAAGTQHRVHLREPRLTARAEEAVVLNGVQWRTRSPRAAKMATHAIGVAHDDFARAVAEAGMVFVGPPPDVISQLGDKLTAHAIARAADVPVIPSTGQPTDSLEDATAFADEHSRWPPSAATNATWSATSPDLAMSRYRSSRTRMAPSCTSANATAHCNDGSRSSSRKLPLPVCSTTSERSSPRPPFASSSAPATSTLETCEFLLDDDGESSSSRR